MTQPLSCQKLFDVLPDAPIEAQTATFSAKFNGKNETEAKGVSQI
jgi:hypothetical protein